MNSENSIYLITAVVGSVLFIIKTAALFLGADADESGVSDSADFDHASHDSSHNFTIFSLQSILAFLMGFGIMGLVASGEWEFSSSLSAIAAIAFGLFLLGLNSWLLFSLRRLNSSGNIDYSSTIGSTAKVYVTIPESSQGQVEVTVNGKLMVLPARGKGGVSIASFRTVRVISVDSSGVLEVSEPEQN